MNRRNCLHSISALGLLPFTTPWLLMEDSITKRAIPSSNETIPVVGLGTWQTFDVGDNEAERDPLKKVLQILIEKGGSVVDSSPMYGSSEKVVGDLSTELRLNDKLFIATKVWTTGEQAGIRQMTNSLSLLKRKSIDLMQIHNLMDWETHLKTLREWKQQGKIRYIGITHYTESAYPNIERILKTTTIDFLQINYSMLSRKAEERLFPLAQEKKVAVIINQPFEEGALFSRVKGKTLPVWAKEFDCNSWGQFFLKFILAQPAVTCVIPGTSKPHHMADNIGAAFGKLPTESHRAQMLKMIE
ncbi:aldo/keto reductase [Chryseolinea sp. H1M3-3]|uniref:aldo/keto reductase n=1 Tax=Chryseolinea sp. H1M3-3 TaxID=3034144 RepID=UPI0023EDA030|nr:aldo/keto reductase [Chryseolinea sp. H1M3-3]